MCLYAELTTAPAPASVEQQLLFICTAAVPATSVASTPEPAAAGAKGAKPPEKGKPKKEVGPEQYKCACPLRGCVIAHGFSVFSHILPFACPPETVILALNVSLCALYFALDEPAQHPYRKHVQHNAYTSRLPFCTTLQLCHAVANPFSHTSDPHLTLHTLYYHP